ncbi:glycosyltransferase family 2 protein [Nonomuraea gerenzanensis]|uniref:Probable glycosyl transferase n=1 Tax=Nonomuraea gerenzanensis TaxID=93944 RepID=A0A1M4DXZ3_9ACTN|nr:glycosyltransferase [Nonomuraea gerenzanensis]UBU13773.1 glycosyltransferase [Nonomuraea gerenzanensis]SBO91444.1 probable glycosyl transferase [Nonomuraea gerenzanensis]
MISIVIISKDEPALDGTLHGVARAAGAAGLPYEIIVVDASAGRLDAIAAAHPHVRWTAFTPPPGVRTTIPHQRNAGVRAAGGEIVVFTDAGCRPLDGWLRHLVAPITDEGESVVCGLVTGPEGHDSLYDADARRRAAARYLPECGTGNLAVRRAVIDEVGGFDETFGYGSDVDFSWRVQNAGHRIRSAGEAVVTHDWGDRRRRLRRSYVYGKARARLYLKHRDRRTQVLRREPMVVVYPLFLLGLPLTLWFPFYPALLLVPAWRNRHNGPVRVLADHLTYGAGVLAELATFRGRARR